MKIASSEMFLSSQHASMERHALRESLRAREVPGQPGAETRSRQPVSPATTRTAIPESGTAAQAHTAAEDIAEAVKNDPRMQLLISMVEALTGRKIRIVSLKDFQNAELPRQDAMPHPGTAGEQPAPRPAAYGIEYERHETRQETEQIRFQASGRVRTADGREITLDLQFQMTREFQMQSDTTLRLGVAPQQVKDPLVISLDGNVARLGATKFSFDLDADGRIEQVSFVASGSGFLALDRNGDGSINNGSELFGPASGNGFAELASYDLDGNNWIDESDAIFAELVIWSRDAHGNDILSSLESAGVGAIHLGSVATEFSLFSSNPAAADPQAGRQLDGQLRASGVYLNNHGSTGIVQQIDLAI